MCYVIWELKKKTTKQNNWQKGKQHFKKMLKEILSNGLMTGPWPYGEDGREGSPEQGTGFMCFMRWSIWKESGKGNLLIGLLKGPPIKDRRTFGYPFFIYIYSYFEIEVVGKSARNNPVRYCGWFLVRCFSKEFERMAREVMDICLWVLKESKKSRFDSCSVSNSILIMYHLDITFRDCRAHIFSDNLSQHVSK